MTLDLAKLREIASKATPGPWKLSRLIRWNVIADEERTLISEPYCEENACHIATFDPPTVLALLDRLEKAETERDELLNNKYLVLRERAEAAERERDEALAKLEQARAKARAEAIEECAKVADYYADESGYAFEIAAEIRELWGKK